MISWHFELPFPFFVRRVLSLFFLELAPRGEIRAPRHASKKIAAMCWETSDDIAKTPTPKAMKAKIKHDRNDDASG